MSHLSQENVSPVLSLMPPLLRMYIPQIKAKEVQTQPWDLKLGFYGWYSQYSDGTWAGYLGVDSQKGQEISFSSPQNPVSAAAIALTPFNDSTAAVLICFP
jgi:hypothetical protein